MQKQLSDLIKGFDHGEISGPADIFIKNITADSREVKPGSLFIAVKGITSDGHKFIPDAINSGAVAIIGDEDYKDDLGTTTYIKVEDSRKVLSQVASAWFGNPARKLKIIGVTGTDGKTTTANLIYWILTKVGKKAGLISTVSAKIADTEYETGFHVTNPEPIPLHGFLQKMVLDECEYAVIEVTSHGLDQERVYGINFDMAVLTNITHEHLDYHKTFENYAKAKAKLFNVSKLAILNSEYKKEIEGLISSSIPKLFYDKSILGGEVLASVEKRFSESYNVTNAAAAVTVARRLGIDDKDSALAIESFPGVTGRMEEIKNDKGIRVIVDFAHTPNALGSVLKTLKENKKKDSKLIAVFGCAGERDFAKRQMMAETSARLADISVFTAEDPRSEKVEDIIAEMLKGSGKVKGAVVKNVPDRGEAIFEAINNLSQKGDTVVICGKGHEKSMNYNGTEYPWSDKEAVNLSLLGLVKNIDLKRKTGKIAVFGLGIEGHDLIRYLVGKGIRPVILEENENYKVDEEFKDLEIIKGEKVSESPLDFEVIYRSPGVYRFREDILEAEKMGVKIESSIRLFFDECPGQIIGVTGTKGKGTTSSLIYAILKEAGKDVYLAGNIGKPYLELLPKLDTKSLVVLELSSFQLIDLNKSPDVSVVLNITSDHLNWHKDLKEYVDAKKNIVEYQNPSDFAVINADYEVPKSFAGKTKAKVLFFSRKNSTSGCYIRKDKEIVLSVQKDEVIGDVDRLLLMGKHNWENVTAAICASYVAGADIESIKKAVFEFKGLEHRLELAGKVNGIEFYNDSFSTNPEPTIAAVKSFEKPMTLILGGYDKGLDYREMGKEIATGRVANTILIGDTREKIKKALDEASFNGKIIDMGRSEMTKIVNKALEITPTGGVVILSPASASFDMFKDYKERGNLFKKAVSSISNA